MKTKDCRTVWKFPIPVNDVVTIRMPRGAKVLHVGDQFGTPTMWALVDPLQPNENREFRFAGTGHPIEGHHIGAFVGTFFMREGGLVFHIFETQSSQIENGSPAEEKEVTPFVNGVPI